MEGDTLPAIAPDVILNFGAAPPYYYTNSGDLFWSCTTNAAASQDQYYFRNKQIIVREGGKIGSGETVKALWAAAYAYDVSPNGRFFLGKVTLDSGGDALFLADFGAIVPTPGCSGNPGTMKKA